MHGGAIDRGVCNDGGGLLKQVAFLQALFDEHAVALQQLHGFSHAMGWSEEEVAALTQEQVDMVAKFNKRTACCLLTALRQGNQATRVIFLPTSIKAQMGPGINTQASQVLEANERKDAAYTIARDASFTAKALPGTEWLVAKGLHAMAVSNQDSHLAVARKQLQAVCISFACILNFHNTYRRVSTPSSAPSMTMCQ